MIEPETVVEPETIVEPETVDDNPSLVFSRLSSSLLDLVQEESERDNKEIAATTILDDITTEAISLTDSIEDEHIVKILNEKELINLFTINSEKFGVDHLSTTEVILNCCLCNKKIRFFINIPTLLQIIALFDIHTIISRIQYTSAQFINYIISIVFLLSYFASNFRLLTN